MEGLTESDFPKQTGNTFMKRLTATALIAVRKSAWRKCRWIMWCLSEKAGLTLLRICFPPAAAVTTTRAPLSVEQFRELVQKIPDTLRRDCVTFKNGVRFGVVSIAREPVVFYYERKEFSK